MSILRVAEQNVPAPLRYRSGARTGTQMFCPATREILIAQKPGGAHFEELVQLRRMKK